MSPSKVLVLGGKFGGLAFEKYFLWKSRHGYVTLP